MWFRIIMDTWKLPKDGFAPGFSSCVPWQIAGRERFLCLVSSRWTSGESKVSKQIPSLAKRSRCDPPSRGGRDPQNLGWVYEQTGKTRSHIVSADNNIRSDFREVFESLKKNQNKYRSAIFHETRDWAIKIAT